MQNIYNSSNNLKFLSLKLDLLELKYQQSEVYWPLLIEVFKITTTDLMNHKLKIVPIACFKNSN